MRFRLHSTHTEDDREPGRLVFPRQALDKARRMAPAPRHREGDVVATIERELDRMQAGIDLLRDDVENYRFPVGFDDGPPVRAA